MYNNICLFYICAKLDVGCVSTALLGMTTGTARVPVGLLVWTKPNPWG